MDRARRLIDAVLLVASDLSLPDMLRRLVEAARLLSGAQYGALGVIGEDGHLAEFITVGIDAHTVLRIGDPPEGHGILGLLLIEPKPIRLRDLSEHPLSYGFPPNHPPMVSFLGVPIRVRGEVFGNLYLTEKQGADGFTAEDEDLVVALAAAAGVAIENARLHSRVRELALIEDRDRIAKDLHDTVIQRIFAVGMALQGAARLAQRPEVLARIQQAVDDLDDTIRGIRSTIFALQTTDTERRGLRLEVLTLATESAGSLGVQPRVTFNGAVDTLIPAGIADHLLSTLREGLTNVARHAKASTVDVEVEAGDEVVLRVADDGVGYEGSGRPGGLGLGNMGKRAEALGGKLSITRRPSGGTLLEWRVPLDKAHVEIVAEGG